MFGGPQFGPYPVCYTMEADQVYQLQDERMGLAMHGFYASPGCMPSLQPALSSPMYLPEGYPMFFSPHQPVLHQWVGKPAKTSRESSSEQQRIAIPAARKTDSWIAHMLKSSFFQPCSCHRTEKKNECTFFCVTCAAAPHSLCQHCMDDHQGHQVIQVRRYVYCDVVRSADISQYMDVAGVQCYIINQSKVAFLNPRPQAKMGRPLAPDTCRTCSRHLREGAAYCCLACKVTALAEGDDWTAPPDADAEDTPAPQPRKPAPSGRSLPVPPPVRAAPQSRSPAANAPRPPLDRPLAPMRNEAYMPASPPVKPQPTRAAVHSANGTSSSCSSDLYLAPLGAPFRPVKVTSRTAVLPVAMPGAMPPATLALLHVISGTDEDEDERCYNRGTPRPTKQMRMSSPVLAGPGTPFSSTMVKSAALDGQRTPVAHSNSSDSEGGHIGSPDATAYKLTPRTSGSLRRKRAPHRSPE